MAKPFSVETKESRFQFPRATRQQIKELTTGLELDARACVIRAVAELHQREIATTPRTAVATSDKGRTE